MAFRTPKNGNCDWWAILHGHWKFIHLLIQLTQQIFIKQFLLVRHCGSFAVLHKADKLIVWKKTVFMVLGDHGTWGKDHGPFHRGNDNFVGG